MEPLEIPGTVQGTMLRFVPAGDGTVALSAMHIPSGLHSSVILRADWLRPVAAWFAGEAQPGITGHDEYGTGYGRWLAVAGDRAALLYGTHTEAQLEARMPFGTARVVVRRRGKTHGVSVMLAPEARQNVAEWLRRADAQHWSEPAA
jgi:hypothetical protein